MGALLCIAALATSVLVGRKGLVQGLCAVLTWGYFYGILRANFPSTGSHFIFDCAMFGFFITQGKTLWNARSERLFGLRLWLAALIIWPCIMLLIPMQNFLVQLVGLRGNIFMLPIILAGALLTPRDLGRLAIWIALLNLAAIGFATAEYFLSVQQFYPYNEATVLIYDSNDVAGYQFLRIPATFANAHGFAGSMVCTLPMLFGAWAQTGTTMRRRIVCLLGMVAAIMGVLMASTRLNVVVLGAVAAVMVFSPEFGMKKRIAIMALVLVAGVVAVNNKRFNRFESLGDTAMVTERITGSVNEGFWDILMQYPMGIGLGAGGTSLPYFLESLVKKPVGMENEYSRILLELGVIGLALWLGFIAWFLFASSVSAPGTWRTARRMSWVSSVAYFGIGMIGIGMLTGVPQTVLLLLGVGWVATPPLADAPEFAARRKALPARQWGPPAWARRPRETALGRSR